MSPDSPQLDRYLSIRSGQRASPRSSTTLLDLGQLSWYLNLLESLELTR